MNFFRAFLTYFGKPWRQANRYERIWIISMPLLMLGIGLLVGHALHTYEIR